MSQFATSFAFVGVRPSGGFRSLLQQRTTIYDLRTPPLADATNNNQRSPLLIGILPFYFCLFTFAFCLKPLSLRSSRALREIRRFFHRRDAETRRRGDTATRRRRDTGLAAATATATNS